MIRLTPDNGIPRHILLMMAVLAGFTVANLYYNQPLLEMICRETDITHVQANLITVITQIGYALGLLFVVPLADMVSLRRIVTTCMSVAALSAVAIGFADNVLLLWGDSYAGLIIAIILADIGAQCLQVSNQSASLQQLPEATNRVNTIFMTTFFIGGSLGTFCSGIGWSMAGWPGVCIVGICFASATLLFSVYEKQTKFV